MSFPFLLALFLCFSLVHSFLLSFPCFHAFQVIALLNSPVFLNQFIHGTALEMEKTKAGVLPMPPGVCVGIKVSRGTHERTSSSHHVACSQSQFSIVQGKADGWFIQKPATGNSAAWASGLSSWVEQTNREPANYHKCHHCCLEASLLTYPYHHASHENKSLEYLCSKA